MSFNPFDKPDKPPNPPGEPKPEKDKEECLKRIQKILKKHGGESNVPPSHEYWLLVNRYRGM